MSGYKCGGIGAHPESRSASWLCQLFVPPLDGWSELSRALSSSLLLPRKYLIRENFNHVCLRMFRPNNKSFLMGDEGMAKKKKKRSSKSCLAFLSPGSDLWSQGWICHQLQIILIEWDAWVLGRGLNLRHPCCPPLPMCLPPPSKNLGTATMWQPLSYFNPLYNLSEKMIVFLS